MLLRELDLFLRQYYRADTFHDYCFNGLQVEGKESVERVVLGVTLSDILIDRAIEYGADCIIVHHGIFERGPFSLRGNVRNRVRRLLGGDISLFGFHNPMDAHPETGHNKLLCDAAGLVDLEPFQVGFIGRNSLNTPFSDIIAKLNSYLGITEIMDDTYSGMQKPVQHCFSYGPPVPGQVCIVSGGSSMELEKAAVEGADTFICGNVAEIIPGLCTELRMNFVNLGHYYTEIPGVKALGDLLKTKFSLDCRFVRLDNNI